jgi:hypothetical protein
MSEKTRMFPLQTSRSAPVGPLQIPWSVAEKAYGAYAREYGRGQSLERLAERGGFGWCEMDTLYPAWRDEVNELAALRTERDKLREFIRYWSYCTHSGMRRECPEKESEFLDACRELGIQPYANALANGAPIIEDIAAEIARSKMRGRGEEPQS